jgi:HK97 family phage major capsid protein
MSLSIRLRQERKQLSEQMRTLLTSTSPSAAEQWRTLDRAQEELRKKIEAIEQDGIERDVTSENRSRAQLPAIAGMEHETSTRDRGVLASAEYNSAFKTYLSTGDTRELRTYAALSPTGSVLIPIGFQKQVEVYMKAIGGLRQCARILPTPTGNPLQYPIEIDTSNSGTWLAPGAGIAQTNPTFSNVTLGADLLSSDQVLVDVELFADSAFSMEALLSESFGVRLARGTASAYMNGNGLNIVGLLPALVAATGRSVSVVGCFANSGNSANTDLNSLGTSDWNAVVEAVDPAYRIGNNVGYVANQSTFDSMRSTLDKYGRPLWQTSLAANEPDRINGFRYWMDQSMSAIGAGNTSVIFGNFEKYIIRDVLGMTLVRYNELYMPNHQLGFEAFMRTFGQLLNPLAFAYLKHPNS